MEQGRNGSGRALPWCGTQSRGRGEGGVHNSAGRKEGQQRGVGTWQRAWRCIVSRRRSAGSLLHQMTARAALQDAHAEHPPPPLTVVVPKVVLLAAAVGAT